MKCKKCKHSDCKSLLKNQRNNPRWKGNVTKCIDCGICLGHNKKKPRGFRCQKCLKERKLVLVCINCGEKITHTAYHNTKMCVPCYRKWAIGENHHNWKGGKAKCMDCRKELTHWNHGTRCRSCSLIGQLNTSWNGGRIVDKRSGYVKVYKPDHPHSVNDTYVLEHRLVMEQHIGRFLNSSEIVHHINGIRGDNRIENLVITNRHEHEHYTLLKIVQKQILELELKIKRLEKRLGKLN